MPLAGTLQELGHTHKILAYISVRGWTVTTELGADQMMYLEVGAKRISMV